MLNARAPPDLLDAGATAAIQQAEEASYSFADSETDFR
jgi:hypothetical protein